MRKFFATPGWALAVICLVNGCWAFSFGIEAPLCSLWLQERGCSDTIIGLNTTTYYFGILTTAGLVPWLMARSARACAGVGLLASGLTVALFPWGGGLFGWFLLRGLNGVAGALTLVPMETLVNQNSPPGQRGRDFGCYALAVAVGMALGAWAGLQLVPLLGSLTFILGGLVTVGAGVVSWLTLSWPAPAAAAGSDPALRWPDHIFSFGTAWGQGFLEGGLVAFLPLYLLGLGYSADTASWLIAGTLLGVVLCQVPAGWLADRLSPTGVLAGCYAAVLLGLSALPFCSGLPELASLLFVVGSCIGAFYPLGLARLGQKLPTVALPQANAWYLGCNCVGSLTGPMGAGAAMDYFGRGALFGVGVAASVLVLAACAVGRARASTERAISTSGARTPVAYAPGSPHSHATPSS